MSSEEYLDQFLASVDNKEEIDTKNEEIIIDEDLEDLELDIRELEELQVLFDMEASEGETEGDLSTLQVKEMDLFTEGEDYLPVLNEID